MPRNNLFIAGISIFIIIIVGVLLIIPHHKSIDELNKIAEDIQVPAPAGVNLTGFEGSWTTTYKRDGKCIRMAILFEDNNPSWSIVSFHRTDPKTGVITAHMINEKDNVVFDPVWGIFFDKTGFFEYFNGKDIVVYAR